MKYKFKSDEILIYLLKMCINKLITEVIPEMENFYKTFNKKHLHIGTKLTTGGIQVN